MKKWINCGIALLSLSVLTLFPWGKPAQAAGGDIEINEQNFQDPSYRDYLYNMIDRDGDWVLSESERDRLMFSICQTMRSLTWRGLRYFQT